MLCSVAMEEDDAAEEDNDGEGAERIVEMSGIAASNGDGEEAEAVLAGCGVVCRRRSSCKCAICTLAAARDQIRKSQRQHNSSRLASSSSK